MANYAKVKFKDVYPGIDMVYYGNQESLEYDFVVKPGADPKIPNRLATWAMNPFRFDAGGGAA